MTEFDRYASEERIAETIDDARRSQGGRERLVALLAENLPLYEGRSSNEVSRIRGYVLAAFEEVGLSASGLPYVLEELESGHDAYLVAAAAKALRGSDTPTEQPVPYLLRAIGNIRAGDDSVSFDSYRPSWPAERPTTALTEIFRTLAWLGPNAASVRPELEAMLEPAGNQFSTSVQEEIREALAMIGADESTHSCCGDDSPMSLPELSHTHAVSGPSHHLDVTFQDQGGGHTSYQGFFTGKPAVVAFFYTRCDNPNKCSLTIAKLAQLQDLIKERGLAGAVKTAAITYDPKYDLPARMRAYGSNRGLQFTDDDRMFRTTSSFAELRERFELGVNFSRTTVNRHRIELYVLDSNGEVVSQFSRLQWEPAEVLESILTLLL